MMNFIIELANILPIGGCVLVVEMQGALHGSNPPQAPEVRRRVTVIQEDMREEGKAGERGIIINCLTTLGKKQDARGTVREVECFRRQNSFGAGKVACNEEVEVQRPILRWPKLRER